MSIIPLRFCAELYEEAVNLQLSRKTNPIEHSVMLRWSLLVVQGKSEKLEIFWQKSGQSQERKL